MKRAREMTHTRSVTAWALIRADKEAMDRESGYSGHAGSVVANYSDGGTVTVDVLVWSGPLAEMPATTGRAGGYGYCKFSAAFSDALNRAGIEHKDLAGRGSSAVRQWLNDNGYGVAQVL